MTHIFGCSLTKIKLDNLKLNKTFFRLYKLTTQNNIVLPAVDVALSSSSSKCSNKEIVIQNKLNVS